MKRVAVITCIAVVLLTLCPLLPQAQAAREPGGIPAFFIGCCWGLREGTEWNEGADMHWREWGRIIPVVGFILGVWDGVECYEGITAHEWAEQNGANWY